MNHLEIKFVTELKEPVVKAVKEGEAEIEKELFKDVSFYRDGNTIYGTYKGEEDSLKFGSRLFKYLKTNRIKEVYLDIGDLNFKEVALGLYLAAYEFDKYKKEQKINKYTIYVRGNYEKDLEEVEIIKDAVYFARDLANEPPEFLNPSTFVKEIEDKFKDLPVNIIVFDAEELKNRGFGGIYGVGKGSNHPPKLLVIEYFPNKDEKPIVLVGKGVCFDAGGIHLKPTGYIEDMKADMHGAASVIAALYGYIKLVQKGFAEPKNIVVLTPIVENLPSGRALKPGDIVKHYNGLTTEIVNTDAEGRLIVADALAYACKHYNPKCIIDLATLTGGQIVALGHKVAAIMGNNRELINVLIDLGRKVKEYLWELPLLDYKDIYLDMVKGEFTDLKNIPSPTSREASSLVGGAFLWHFVEEKVPWVHLDIAGPAIMPKEWEWMNKGGSGFGVRLLLEFLKNKKTI